MKISIPKDKISELPTAQFLGNIYVIDSMAKMSMAVNALRKEQVVGFDSETRPSFSRGKNHKVALLQISTFTDCFLFRLCKIGLPQKLKEFLEDDTVKKVGLSLNNDMLALHRFTEINPKGFIDLQDLVKDYSIVDQSLQRIYAIIFDKKISKAQRLSNWEAMTLTTAQQHYAALDAFACLETYDWLTRGNFIPEESEYIVNEEETTEDETEKI